MVSLGGVTLERPLYLVVEDGEYRFAGARPEGRAVTGASQTVPGEQVSTSPGALNAYDWPHWQFDNSANPQPANILCGNALTMEPDGMTPGVYFLVPERSSVRHTCPSWQCSFFGSTCTYIWGDPKPCYYQVFGRDVWRDLSGYSRWRCVQ